MVMLMVLLLGVPVFGIRGVVEGQISVHYMGGNTVRERECEVAAKRRKRCKRRGIAINCAGLGWARPSSAEKGSVSINSRAAINKIVCYGRFAAFGNGMAWQGKRWHGKAEK